MKISIHKPCSESWAQMEDLGSRRFCASCQKCVTDFTQLTDSAIAQIIESQEGELCGRFNADQLDRALMLNDSKQNKYLTALFSMSLASMIGFQNEIQAKPMLPIGMNHTAKDTLNPFVNQSPQPQNISKDSIGVHGVVQDSATGEPLVGVAISLEGDTQWTFTNVDGKFEWQVSKNKIRKNTHLIVSFTGYTSKSILFSTIIPNKPTTILLDGGIALGGYMVTTGHNSFKRRVKLFFRKIFQW